MKTFKQFLTEDNEPTLQEFLKQNCSQFCREAKIDISNVLSSENLLYRGLTNLPSGRTNEPTLFGKRIINSFTCEPRKNRVSLSMPTRTHEIIDDYLLKEFKFRARSNVIFCTGNKRHAGGYGEPYAIFPYDGYKFVWSDKSEDLYNTMIHVMNASNEEILNYITDLKFTDKDLQTATKSGNEIMLNCSEYFAIPMPNEEEEEEEIDYDY